MIQGKYNANQKNVERKLDRIIHLLESQYKLHELWTEMLLDAIKPDEEVKEVKQSQLKEYAIIQAEHMRAQVGDNTWHYAMEVWLYPETHYWEVEDEVALIERYISTNRDAWVKHWGEPSDMAQRRDEE